jgi:hypothetical protein
VSLVEQELLSRPEHLCSPRGFSGVRVTRSLVLYVDICQGLTAGHLFSSGTPVSATNKTDRHDIAEILLKVVLNTLTLNPPIDNENLTSRHLRVIILCNIAFVL